MDSNGGAVRLADRGLGMTGHGPSKASLIKHVGELSPLDWAAEVLEAPAHGQTARHVAAMGAKSVVGALLVLERCIMADQSTMESCS